MPVTIRPNVLKMIPYTPGKPIDEVKRELGVDRVVKLASNENPLGPSPKAIEAVKGAASQMHLYPDASGYELRHALSAKSGLPMENVMIGNGSDELIHLLGLVLLQPGDNMVVAEPTFVRYHAAAELADIEIVRVPLDSAYRHDLTAMASACNDRTRLLFVANPHNPTGTVCDPSAIRAFLDSVPSHVSVVLDEAYAEYLFESEHAFDSIGEIRAGGNVVVLRTFSKAYGLAGIRIGYGFASAEIVDAIDRAREPFHVNSLAQVAAIAALQDDDHLRASIEVNQRGIARITEVAAELGLSVVPSYANFILIHLGRPSRPVFDALLRQGIIVRPGEPLGLPTSLRVSIGTEQEIEEFVVAFRGLISAVASV